MKLIFDRWIGRMKRREASGLPPEHAQIADNVYIMNGDARPLERPAFVVNLAKTGVKTIYRFGQTINSATQYWFHWTDDVDVAKGQIANDTSERTFWTGDGVPRYTTAALGTTGGNLPANSRPLALPPPTVAPTLAPVAGTGAGNVFRRLYVYVFVDEFGSISAPSPIGQIDILPNQHVTLSGLQAVPSNSVPIVARRIYRADAGEYLFVTELDNTATTFLDDVSAEDLGEPIPSTTWSPPRDSLKGLANMPNGMMVGFDGYDVCFCVPYRPYAWPEEDYVYAMAYPVVAVVPFDQSVAVLTTGAPSVLTGIDPAGMSQENTKFLQPCVSKRGAVSTGGQVMYPSNDGICVLGAGTAIVATSALFSAEDWKQFRPETITAVWHDDWYIGTYLDAGNQRRGFMFQPTAQAWIDLPDFAATAFFRDTVTDKLYCCIGDQIHAWRDGAAWSMLWRTKRASTPLAQFSHARVLGTYPVTLRVRSDGVLRDTVTVTDDQPFLVDTGELASSWELELTGATGSARTVVLAESKAETREVS